MSELCKMRSKQQSVANYDVTNNMYHLILDGRDVMANNISQKACRHARQSSSAGCVRECVWLVA